MKIVLQILIMIACLCGLMALSNLLTRLLSRTLRKDWLYYLILAPGTIIHELCHTVASLILLVPVCEVHLFRLRHEPDGTVQLGEVVHDNTDPIRNFLIAMAPLFGAGGIIYGLSVWLLPKGVSWEQLLTNGWTYLFLVIVFFVALGLSPSRQDLKALPAFLITALVVGCVCYFIVWMVSKKVNLSSTAVAVEKALRTANTGLVFVLVMVAVVLGVLLVVGEVVRR